MCKCNCQYKDMTEREKELTLQLYEKEVLEAHKGFWGYRNASEVNRLISEKAEELGLGPQCQWVF